jgi:hypothetical protein
MHTPRLGLSLGPLFLSSLTVILVIPNFASAQAAKPRKLAPGVMITIPPEIEPEETVSTHNIVEIRGNVGLSWKPNFLAETRTLYDLSEDVKFRRDIWCLEFSFKPVRMIEVDVPQPSGRMQQKRVWYMVYEVKNTGNRLSPTEQPDESFVAGPSQSKPVRFIPHMVLEGQDRDASGKPIYKAYLDQVIPAAVEAIQKRETPGRRLLNSVQMADEVLPVTDGRSNQGVWGVAIWADVDPRIDFFSVYVSGLSNAYRWVDPPGAYQIGDSPGKGRRFARKTLQLNFWRPGDEFLEHEGEIRFGVPKGKAQFYDVDPGVAYRWIYR